MIEVPGYELIEQVYASARSLVYRGRREADGLPVMVKVPAGEHPTPQATAALRREHEIGRLVEGEGSVTMFACEQLHDRWAIVMEDFGARSLASLSPRSLDLREAVRVGARVATALAAIHRRRFIHKDVSPGNIVRNPATGQLKLIDFGLSAVLPRGSAGIRTPNVLDGTLQYISPEQTGRMNRAVDHRSDLYSTGAVLYELLTGRAPFDTGDPLALVHLHIAERPVPPHERDAAIPVAVSDIVMKLLAKNAEDRYQSAEGLAADLEECLDPIGTGARGAALAPFVPGRNDAPSRFQISQELYGRSAEVAPLLATFERAAGGRAELLLVAGYSGVGKTTLVNEIHRPLIARRGYYVSGKFDQLRRDIPYAPLIQAFSDLVRQILTEPEARLAAWGERLRAALGSVGAVIVDVIPNVARIIGAPSPAPALAPGEAQNRFNFAMRRFVQALAAQDLPLVIFLDDLQWADLPSLQLIQQLIGDPEIRNLLIIGAYRDNEVGPDHPLALALSALSAAGATMTRLELAPLDYAHVEQLIADSVRGPRERAAPLARLVFERTLGNPFFLSQLLQTLHEDGLITFDAPSRAFRWDLDAIRARGITADVVDLMAGKIQRLPVATQEALKLAACINGRFDVATLAIARQRSARDTLAELRDAVDEGLLLTLEGSEIGGDLREGASFRFLHDRVQQAAYSLIAEADRPGIHVAVGRLLLESTPAADLDARLFDIVNQLDMGLALITSAEERYAVARLNLLAARKATASAAHEPALRYLSAGLALLPEGAWTSAYELCFALHAEAMEAEYLNARGERAEALSEILLERAASVLDKVKVYETRIVFKTVSNELRAAAENGYQAMALLGVDLPREIDLPSFLTMLAATKQAIGDRRAADLLDLPAMTSPEQLAAMRIAVLINPPVYQINALLALAFMLRFVELALPHGNSPESPFLYADYALILAGILGDFDGATEYGQLSLKLVARAGHGRMRAKVYFLISIFVTPWKQHLRDTIPLLIEAVQTGLESGDLEFMSYAAATISLHLLLMGEPLENVAREHARYAALLRRYRLGMMLGNIVVMHQTALNLMGGAADPQRLAGEIFDEDAEVPAIVAAENNQTLAILYNLKTMLACLFRDAPSAVAMAALTERYVQAQTGQFIVVVHTFYQAMALLGALGSLGDEERAASLEKVTASLEKLRRCAEAAPMSSLHRVQLVEAELARVRGDDLGALRLYAAAIESAARHRWLHEEALAHELEGELYLARGLARQARASLSAARYAYQRWGAAAKVADLDARYPQLFARASADGRRGAAESTAKGTSLSVGISSSSTDSGALFDLPAVLRSAQAISGEIILDRLLDKLMQITLENAGAQRGLFLLPRDGDGALEIAVERPAAPSRLPALASGDELASWAIVQYVVRTGESLLLADASAEGLFTADPYVVRRGSRSILCAPLLNQNRLVGVVYLENDLAAGAFTEDRLEVLRLLSAQAALSIHNARLYAKLEDHSRTLEQKVEARTRELTGKNEELGRALLQLRETQAQLVIQEKLASLGALTAAIAHEIKNPLNFITNFALISVDTAGEIAAAVRAQKGRLAPDAVEELEDLSASLQQCASKVDEHGRRATHIIDGMLLHARDNAGAREKADINAVVAESVSLACHAARGKEPGFELSIDAAYDPAIGHVDLVSSDFGRVIINIVNNACYAVRQKQKAASARYAGSLRVRTADRGERVEVRIRDNGCGVPSAIMDRVFNPFFTTKPPGEGTGLGLSISHDIITGAHRGELRMESVEGEFTEFVITLPKQAVVGA